jgi:hypothetical protein
LNDSLKFQVVLRAYANERVTSRLLGGFNEAGDLVLEGHDTGDFVEEVWGDDDYEYWLTVHAAAVPKLAEELGLQVKETCPAGEAERQAFVMGVLKKLFSEGASELRFSSDSEFKKWLEGRGIPSDFSSWP